MIQRRLLPTLEKYALLFACGMTFLACERGPATPIGNLTLETGESIRTLTVGYDTTIALIYDPADCFTCSGVLADWIEAQQSRPIRVLLILTRAPVASEARMLTAFRVPVAGILAQSWRPSPHAPSKEALFVHGEIIASASVQEPKRNRVQQIMRLQSPNDSFDSVGAVK